MATPVLESGTKPSSSIVVEGDFEIVQSVKLRVASGCIHYVPPITEAAVKFPETRAASLLLEAKIRGSISEDEDAYANTVTRKMTTEAALAHAEDELAKRPNSKAKQRRVESLRSTLAKIQADLETHPGRGRFEDIKLPPLT